MTRCSKLLLVALLVTCQACALAIAPPATTKLYTSGTGDASAGRDWWSNPNYYWLDNGATVASSHDGSSRWLMRGVVIIDISPLAGRVFSPNSVTFNFYSFGYSGTQLQHIDGDPGPVVTTGFAQAGGSYVADLDGAEGWKSYDVTSFLQSDVNAGFGHVGFIFPAANYSGGSIAASEDSQGRGAYLEVVNAPEPNSLFGLLAGIPGIAGLYLRRRRP